jgi:peptide/nickel transport system substrate-binding protein
MSGRRREPGDLCFYPPIGTGPYTLTSGATNRAIWDRNDDWWGASTGFQDMPAPQRLIFLETGGEESRAQLMATNQMDAAQNVSIGTFEAMQAQNPNVIAWHDGYPYAWPDPCARQMEINTTVAPWDERRHAQGRGRYHRPQQIVNIAYEGTTVAVATMFVQYGSMAPFIDAVEIRRAYGLPRRRTWKAARRPSRPRAGP